jgi:hypothetical protein
MPFSRLFSVATVFALLLTATEAFSDENLLFFSQDSGLSGAMGNSLFPGQSLASGSRISGFLNSDIPAIQSGGNNQTKNRVTKRNDQVKFNQTNLGGGVNNAQVNLGGPLAAGILMQDGFGNEGSLIVNGEMANSRISGFLNSDIPAIKSGGNNQTENRVTKSNGQVKFNQANLGGGLNNANVNLGSPLAAGIVLQDGFGNEGSLIVNGEMANAALFQEGNRNHGYVDVSGVGTSGIVTQKGDNNNTSLKVSGNGTTVILLQEGDNISSSLAVKSGGRTVTIKQTNP